MLPSWPVQQSPECYGFGGGTCQPIVLVFWKVSWPLHRDPSSAGHYRPEGGVWLVDLEKPLEFRGIVYHGIHGFIFITI